MRSLALFLSLLVTTLLCAQPQRAEVADFPFVRKDLNILQFPGNFSVSEHYFSKMRELMLFGQGQIRVLHIGGSHIQADIYSNRMRNHLANFIPNVMSSRGLIFPYTMAKTNNPRNFKVSYDGKWTTVRNVNKILDNPLGLSGISVSTKEVKSEIKISFDVPKETKHVFKRLRVLHASDSNSFDLRWLSDDTVVIEKQMGYTDLIFSVDQTEIKLGFAQNDSLQNRFELHGLILESNYPGFIYSSVGVNGASTWSYLKCELFGAHLQLMPPDLVFFGIGINDAHDPGFTEQNYKSNYEKIIAQFKAVNPNTFFVFVTNNDSYGYNKKWNSNGEIVRKVMFDLAKSHNGAVWDLYSIMGGATSSNQWRDAGLMAKDRVHFSGEGYNLLGDLLYNAFIESFENFLIKNKNN